MLIGAPVGGPAYENPWQSGYYAVEQNARDGHFWYRMAKHFKDPEFLWAAEQVILGGKGPDGKVSPEYIEAYNKRFGGGSYLNGPPLTSLEREIA